MKVPEEHNTGTMKVTQSSLKEKKQTCTSVSSCMLMPPVYMRGNKRVGKSKTEKKQENNTLKHKLLNSLVTACKIHVQWFVANVSKLSTRCQFKKSLKYASLHRDCNNFC